MDEESGKALWQTHLNDDFFKTLLRIVDVDMDYASNLFFLRKPAIKHILRMSEHDLARFISLGAPVFEPRPVLWGKTRPLHELIRLMHRTIK